MHCNLEDQLTRLLGVGQDALSRVHAGVAAGRSAARRARRVRQVALGAAALLAVACWLWSALAAPRTGGSLFVRRDLTESRLSFDEPPSFGDAASRSDWLLLGKVQQVSEQAVQFDVQDVLRGARSQQRVELSREFDAQLVSCRHDLTWTEGETLLLALHRDPDDGVVKVTDGGSGQGRLPLGGIVELMDVRDVLATGTLPPAIVAERVRRHGPAAIGALRDELYGLLRRPIDVAADVVQAELETWLSRPAVGEGAARQQQDALQLLLPERLRALPRERLDELVAAELAAAVAEPSPHACARRLRPFSTAKVAAVLPALRELVTDVQAKVEARPGAYGYRQLLLELLEQWSVFERDAAIAAAWQLFEVSPWTGDADRGHVLRLLLQLGDPRAERALLDRSRVALENGEVVWLELLITRPAPEARALLRAVLADTGYSLGRNRYDHDPTRWLRQHGVAQHLDDLRDVLVGRLRDDELSVSAYHDWLELYLLRFTDLSPFASTLARQLERLDDTDFDDLRLARLVEQALHMAAFPYRQPTVEELREAARRMAARLRE